MDIELELNQIKKKYFENSNTLGDNVIEYIREIMKNIPDDSSIAIRGGGEHTAKLLELIPDTKNVIGIFDANSSYTNNSGRIRSYPSNALEDYEVDVVIVSSFKYRSEIRKELEGLETKELIVIDIYDELAKQGIYLEKLFYYYSAYPYCEITDLQDKYDLTEDKAMRESILSTMIEKCIDIRDFITLEHYIGVCRDESFKSYDIYNSLWNEITLLLEKMQRSLDARRHKDILVLWNDSVPYEKLDNLPYLKEISKDSLFFENAYTATPYTEPTFMTMFAKKYVLDQYQEDNSVDEFNTFKEMEKNGYHPIWIGNDRRWVKEYKEKGLECNMTTVWGPSTVRYWQMLYYLLIYDKPLFITVHAVVETHEPYLSPIYKNPQFSMKAYRDEYQSEDMLQQIDAAFHYWDQQVRFYDRFVQYDCTRIYMSDHGTWLNMDEARYDEKAIHIILFVQDKELPGKRCKELFGLYNFYELLQFLVKKSDENFEKIFSEEILIQDVDIFDKDIVRVLVDNDKKELGMAYRGILTKDDKYVKISNGKEYYAKDVKQGDIELEDDASRRELLKVKAGDKFIDLKTNDTFIYSQELYEN